MPTTANGTPGRYAVTATVAGVGPGTFALVNTEPLYAVAADAGATPYVAVYDATGVSRGEAVTGSDGTYSTGWFLFTDTCYVRASSPAYAPNHGRQLVQDRVEELLVLLARGLPLGGGRQQDTDGGDLRVRDLNRLTIECP